MFQHGRLLGERECALTEGEREASLAVNNLADIYHISFS